MAKAPYHFQKISQQAKWEKSQVNAKSTEAARKWYQDSAAKLKRARPTKIMLGSDWMSNIVNEDSIGRMIMFFYDPKHKEKLPYYDTFPLVLPLDLYPDGFLGVNLHYVYPFVRARILDTLYKNNTDDKLSRPDRVKLNYGVLKSVAALKKLQPCVKRYLSSHVKSQFLYVPPEHWDSAVYLPTERFKKANKNRVWMESSGAVD